MVAPERGDLVWITIDPVNGGPPHRRPALVVSPALYNARSGLALMCAVGREAKGYPFEVALPAGLPVEGVVLADHLRSADWKARRAELAGRVPVAVVDEVLAKLKPL
ncbi:MAG TPA: type II toxin-antitoxin system PemK/MazF family toxin [Gemmatimonadales bacterium]|nr:type II toxin-antitoxin system PemK/MazF family toxin [Gemmatimonadales bacterium]